MESTVLPGYAARFQAHCSWHSIHHNLTFDDYLSVKLNEVSEDEKITEYIII